MNGSIAVTIFIVALLASIMLHEWGHFASARRFGMRADRFFLGFGPTVWSIRRGETEYGVKAIPAGGFVRILGMSPVDERRRPLVDELLDPERIATDRQGAARLAGVDVLDVPALPDTTWQRLAHILEERGTPAAVRARMVDRIRRNLPQSPVPDDVRPVLVEVIATETSDTGRLGDLQHRLVSGDEGRFFHDRPAWQRAIVLAAGSAMHFTIAIVVLFGAVLFIPQVVGTEPVVNEVQSGSAAEEAGLLSGDELVSVNGVEATTFEEFREVVRSRPDTPTEVVVLRDGAEVAMTLTPSALVDEATGETFGLAGFTARLARERATFSDALYETFVGQASVPRQIQASLTAVGRVFGPEGIGALFQQVSGEAERDPTGAISIVGAGDVTAQAAEYGVLPLLLMIASINVFIGVFNMLPLPPLDGGHLAVLAIERSVNAIRRRRGRGADFSVDPRAVAAVALPVIVIFGVVSLALIWLDITNPIVLQ